VFGSRALISFPCSSAGGVKQHVISQTLRDLAEFLREHPLDVDLRVTSWRADEDDSCTVTLVGNPWWRAPAERDVPDVEILVRCEGVRRSYFQAADWSLQEDDLVVEADAPEIWASGTHATLFGNSPIRDPARFFISWWDLVHALGAESIADLDSTFAPFAKWAERVSSNSSYTLLKGPRRLLEKAQPLLKEQGVEYQLVSGAERSTEGLRLVAFGSSWLVCERATIDAPGTV
jgi:hypothetical protein